MNLKEWNECGKKLAYGLGLAHALASERRLRVYDCPWGDHYHLTAREYLELPHRPHRQDRADQAEHPWGQRWDHVEEKP